MNYAEMSERELDAELAIQEGVIESLKGDTVRQSQKYWKAVEIKIKIAREIERRKS